MKKIILIIFILLTSGCWNYRELNNSAIATAMSIDYSNNEYEVSLLFATGKTKEETKSEITIQSAKGKTIYEAIKNISLSTPKDIYISHLSLVIISSDIAKNGLNKVFDYLLREPQSHQNFDILIAKEDSAKNILSVINPLADYPSQNIVSTIKITEQTQARITNSSFNKFISKILDKGINPVSNSITLIGDNKVGSKKEQQENSTTEAHTKLDTLGIFKEDKLITWANNEESIGINMLLGDIDSLYLTIPCINNKDNNIVITTSNYKIKNITSKKKIDVVIKLDGTLNEVCCGIDLENKEVIEYIKKETIKKLKSYTYKAIRKARNYETDIFGYGNLIYKKYPRYYKKINNWDKEFLKLDINVNIDFNLNNRGSTEYTIGGI